MGSSLGLGPASPREAGGKGASRPRGEEWPGDERAARRFAAGEPGSLELLVRRFADDLFPLAARLAGAERGEALLEEAFLRAVASRERYRGEPPLGEWLRSLVVQSAADGFGSVPQGPARDEGEAGLAPPFALASRLVARVEERQGGAGGALRRAGFFGRRTRFIAIAGVLVGGVLVALGRRSAPPAPKEPEAVSVFFDSSQVVKEAVTPPGKTPVVTVHPAKGEAAAWRLVSPAVGPRVPFALTALYRLDLDPSGRVTGVKKLFSVPSAPPDGTLQMIEKMRFEAIEGVPPTRSVDVRIVAE
jgi:hypothetical protein